jgi:hypothetical protein
MVWLPGLAGRACWLSGGWAVLHGELLGVGDGAAGEGVEPVEL